MKTSISLETLITKERLDEATNLEYNTFGNIVLKCIGYNAICTRFCKCTEGGYNIAWLTEDGSEYIRTFSEETILESFKGKCWILILK